MDQFSPQILPDELVSLVPSGDPAELSLNGRISLIQRQNQLIQDQFWFHYGGNP